MFGRKSSGEPAPPTGRVLPDETVLDELSRAFGDAGDTLEEVGVDAVSDNAELIADDDTAPTNDELFAGFDDATDPPVEPIELSIVTSEDVGTAAPAPAPSTGPAERKTIKIGDDFGAGMIDSVSIGEARGRPTTDDASPNDAVITSLRDVGATSRTGAASSETRSPIAIGGGEDLPDAVYLDDSQGLGDDSGGTVFIDDDGTGDAIAAKDATAPGMEPRLRQRRIGVRRAASRKRIKWVILGAIGLVGVFVVLTVLGSGLFAIDEIDVTGNVYTDETRLAEVIADLDGTPVLRADTDAAELALELIPWVEDARVRAEFPGRATIEIRERTPVATMRGSDGQFRVLDATGRVLDVIEGQPVAFVLLGGPSTLDIVAGEFAPIGPTSAASLVTKLTPAIRPRVLSIDVTDDGADLVINLSPDEGGEQATPIRVRFGSAIGDGDQIEKLVRLENQLGDLPSGVVSEINVATDEVTVL